MIWVKSKIILLSKPIFKAGSTLSLKYLQTSDFIEGSAAAFLISVGMFIVLLTSLLAVCFSITITSPSLFFRSALKIIASKINSATLTSDIFFLAYDFIIL